MCVGRSNSTTHSGWCYPWYTGRSGRWCLHVSREGRDAVLRT